MALIVPFDALRFAVNYVWERLEAFEAGLFEMAAKIPIVGDQFKGLAADARQLADEHKILRDNTYNTMVTHQELVAGHGALFDASAKVRTAIHEAGDAMERQQRVADAATVSTNDLAVAQGAAAEAAKQAARAQAELNAQMEAMDAWSLKIKNTDPYAYLSQGMTKTLTPLAATTAGLQTAAAAMKDTGGAAIDMSDDVKFAAEVVQKATLSWSDGNGPGRERSRHDDRPDRQGDETGRHVGQRMESDAIGSACVGSTARLRLGRAARRHGVRLVHGWRRHGRRRRRRSIKA